MKAIILAAGVGARLRPLTSSKPKSLVKPAGKPILQYQLDAYKKAGIIDVYIVVGYESQAIIDYCKHIKDINITLIENSDYETTNNMYSCYLAKDALQGNAFILSNADVAIESSVVTFMVNSPDPDLIAVEKDSYNDESMKLSVDCDGYIRDISKQISKDDAYGCSIDFYKFSGESSEVFFNKLTHIIEHENNLKDWTEIALQRLFQEKQLNFKPVSINGLNWVEIDNYDDLALADRIFSNIYCQVSEMETFFIDLDGTIYIGDEIIDGSIDTIKELQVAGKSVFFISNNSSKSKKDYVDKLSSLGLSINKADILLSTDGLISFLKQNQVKKVWPLGTSAFAQELTEAGFEICDTSPEYVVVGYDTELTYDKLSTATLLIHKGTDYLATHCDIVCPTANGPIPDIGSITRLLEHATNIMPKHVFGKPNRSMISYFMDEKNTNPLKTAIIGDRIYTDIELAKRTGVHSILVLSGESSREDVEDMDTFPSLILDDIAQLTGR